MKKLSALLLMSAVLLAGCRNSATESCPGCVSSTEVEEVLPITGTFINLPYQDVRNKYTNPQYLDNTDPKMWESKVVEMKKMGMEYIVLMSVANEG